MDKSDAKLYSHSCPSIEEIKEKLNDSGEDGLVVTPLIFPNDQIHSGAVDVRLGNEFIISKRIRFETIDPSKEKEELELLIKQYQEKVYVDLGDKIILHPHQFILGSTLEHVKLPKNLLAYVIGRSSWGRLGLIIATATVVNPEYSGAITLELTNVGDAPITLYPGTRIAQLVFHYVNPSESKPKRSKYQISTGPVFSKIYEDDEWDAYRFLQKKDQYKDLLEILNAKYVKGEISKEQFESIKKVLTPT